MSDQRQAFAFPQRTPVFTAIVVLIGILLFGWFINKFYHAGPGVDPRGKVNPADFAEDVRWKMAPEGRAKRLSDLHTAEQTKAASYGWVDQKAGVAHIPLDRAIELTVRDHAKK